MKLMLRLAFILLLAGNALAAPLVLRPEVPVSEPVYGVLPSSHYDAKIATDGNEYLTVWTDRRGGGEHAVWAARLRADGTLIDPTGLRVAESGSVGGVVWTGSKYLIAYDDGLGNNTYVRSMTPDGVFGEPIRIFQGNGGIHFGAMATNGTNVLVVLYYNALMLDLDGNKLRDVTLSSPSGTYSGAWIGVAGSTYMVGLAVGDVAVQAVSSDGVAGPSHLLGKTDFYDRVALATDGERFLAVWGQKQLTAQFVALDGTPIGTPAALTPGLTQTSSPSATWRDGEYLVTFSDQQEPAAYSLRLKPDGTPAAELKKLERRVQRNVEMATLGSNGIVMLDGVRAAVFDDASVTANEPFRRIVDVAVAARLQTNVHLARLGNGYVTAWEEDDLIFLSLAAGMVPVAVAGSDERLLDVLVDGDNVIWVVWAQESTLAVTRFTSTLQPIDDAPQYFHTSQGFPYNGAAAGGGVIALSFSKRGDPDEIEDWDAWAMLLRPAGGGIQRTDVQLTAAQYDDRNAAVAFDGTSFVYGWIHQKGPYARPHTADPNPATEILAARVSPDGELLDATPVHVADTPEYAIELLAARGANGVGFAWQMYEHGIQGALLGGPVRDYAGTGMTLGALSPHDGGFLLLRGHARRTPELTEIEYLTLGADLSLLATGVLLPHEADNWWKGFDVDVIGGRDPVFAYARMASEGRYGHVSRVFVRRAGDAAPRRRVVR